MRSPGVLARPAAAPRVSDTSLTLHSVSRVRLDSTDQTAQMRVVREGSVEQLTELGPLGGGEARAGGRLDEPVERLARGEPARGDLGGECVEVGRHRSRRPGALDRWLTGELGDLRRTVG